MKWAALFVLFIAAAGAEDIEEPDLVLADQCDPEACKLPDCRCSSTEIPGGLAARDTPQFVIVTFDDGVNIRNIETYRRVLYDRTNVNGCPSGATFFVNHEYTDYQLINELYNQGYEIALHSMTHRTPQGFWAEATYEDMKLEFADQRIQMAHFANIPEDSIKGMRIPFLQLAGNSSFSVIKDYGLTYDLTWPTITQLNPGLWPYTLDYASTQDCPIGPCPSASIPGTWVIPMVSWKDLNGIACSMVDSCYWKPDVNDEDAWFEFIVKNFETSYLGNRAPFGFYVHEWLISTNPAIERAFTRFLNLVSDLEDAFLVNAGDVVDWVRNPVKIDEYKSKPCNQVKYAACPAVTCPAVSEHNGMEYWMTICNTCPRVYPWIGNPLGL